MATALSEVQEELKDVCEIFTRLTSLLIEFGYEVFVNRMNDMSEIECLETTMRVLEVMEEISTEAQEINNNSNRSPQINEGSVIAGSSMDTGNQERILAKIDGEKLKDLIKESLEDSIKEQIPARRFRTHLRDVEKYKDSMDELLAALKSVEPPKKPENFEISNEKLRRFSEQSKAWRERTYQDSVMSKKWKPQQPKQIDYFYDDGPSTSANHNTSINVQNLNLEI